MVTGVKLLVSLGILVSGSLAAESADLAVRDAGRRAAPGYRLGCPLGYACYSLYGAYGPWGGALYWGAYSFQVDRRYVAARAAASTRD